MAGEATTSSAAKANPSRKRIWAKRTGWLLAILLAPLLLAGLFLSTSIGKRFVTDQIAQVSPASGLRFEVGRIEGDIYGAAVLHDVTVKDTEGTFLTIPEAELDWNPLAWIWSGIDIRELTARRGTLQRLPQLLPGDPDAPILPDFDIRIDDFTIDNLTLAEGVAGEASQRVDFQAEVDIRKGRALIDAEGAFGSEDTLDMLIDAEPDGDRFDLALDYRAAADGPIAALAGLDAAYEARIAGEGTWSDWLGHALVQRQTDAGTSRVAGFRLTNSSGVYGAIGQVTPDLASDTLMDRAVGDALSLAVSGTLQEAVFDGVLAAVSPAIDLRGQGALDLAANSADPFRLRGNLRDPGLFAGNVLLEGLQFSADLDGPFRDLVIGHEVTVDRLVAGELTTASGLRQTGTAAFDGEALRVPLAVTSAQIVTGYPVIDPRLQQGTLSGLLTLTGSDLAIDNALVAFDGLNAQLSLRGDVASGAYALAGPVTARGLALENVGSVNANSKILLTFGSQVPWNLNANISGVLSEIANTSLANIAGEPVRFDGSFGMGAGRPIVMRDVEIDSERLQARLDSRIIGERTTLSGSGEHNAYGPFTFDAELAGEGASATLVLANPYPAAGLSNVRLGIAPSETGFAIAANGRSLLGPFEGTLGLALPADAPARIDIERLRVTRTNVTGSLNLLEDYVEGTLAVNGGGLDGTIALAPSSEGAQAFDVELAARRAGFGGEVPLSLAHADIEASGFFTQNSSRIEADMEGRRFAYGALSIDAFNVEAEVIDGRGSVQAAIAGSRADRFQLKFDGDFEPGRIAVIAQGEYGGRPITMPRRAVLTALDDGGYRLAPTQIGYARGYAIAEGMVSGNAVDLDIQLARMPLRLADLAGAELGLGGRLSGVVNWRMRGDAPPTGSARVRIDDFTRSGLVLSSRPIDVFVVADLAPTQLSIGARLREGDSELGRLDARVTGITGGADFGRRIMRGQLDARLSYQGPAQSLWRLAAIETFDLTGPLSVEARATGTLDDPRLTGDLSSDDLRLQSAISGTDINDINARGRFAGSRLELTQFAGSTRGGGSVSGSGYVDLANISASRGPEIDIRAAVTDARLLNAAGLDATLTGPLRIVSNGVDGTIAGRVTVNRASWALGVAAEDLRLPTIATREINRADSTTIQSAASGGSWRYLVDARARRGIAVDGMGLASEWGADIVLRGTVDDPRIGGEARLVRGDYTFAGTRFELTEGRIEFDENRPIDPRLDIEAEASANGTNVTIAITGNAQTPEIGFSATPALPEEEILARLLFGGSVTSLSATDAVQLGAALAALQGGGGGIDPIGQLRRSIGLDQLRIVSADPALGRGTGVALGKNLGRRFYIELVTDGQGYSASQVEYRVTSWLALLGTVSTIGRDSVLAEISRDY
ncbi:translocation/assembly module TamB domain-containing protein [uncultured Erythrobacter sp.]|uniref:translocation/assembly module TamB domain-containing protein n=1 Tax=uncultured Erythrobacter sp. TaxID=263913 RepID=UPI002622B791|nr:translocation/assembly module TamB domain-containing protein [uncultured Erythrobacter sp.]